MRAVEVTGGITYVSDVDYEWVSSLPGWRICRHNAAKKPYVKRTVVVDGKNVSIYLHRAITNCPKGFEADHRNGDGLLNTRGNLRIASPWQNRANTTGYGLTGYKGVTRSRSRFRARLSLAGEHFDLGTYRTAEDAARAYDAKAFELFAEFAWLNFPHEFPITDIEDTF